MAAVRQQKARRIAGAATAESDWQSWLPLLHPPALDWAALVAGAQRLVVVAPHPDDELLACGGALAMQAVRGGHSLVIGVTDGERSHGASPEGKLSSPALSSLAATRTSERLGGLRRLGLPAPDVIALGLPDTGVAEQIDGLLHRLTALLRPADLVVSTWCLDGHPDHDASGSAAARACQAVGCRHLEAPVWMWHWAAPGDLRVPWQRLVAVPLTPSALAKKQHALAAHVSQLLPRAGGLRPVLGEAIVARAGRDFEYFLR